MDDFDPQSFLSDTASTTYDTTPKDFNPQQFLSQTAPQPSYVESGLRGFAQGATFGYSDELAGAGRAALAKIMGDPMAFEDLYAKYRDAQRAEQHRAQAGNPMTYLAGQTAGAIAPAIIPGMEAVNPAAAKTLLGPTGALARGALAGGLMAGGESEAPVTSPAMLDDVVQGAGIGAAVGGVTSALPKLNPADLQATANQKAVKAAGAMTKEMRSMGPEGIQQVGQSILDKKLFGLTDSLDEIADSAGNLKEKAGQAIGAALGKVDDLVQTWNKLIDSGSILPDGASTAQKDAAKNYLANQFQFSGQKIADRIENEIIQPNINPQTGVPNPILTNELTKLQSLADNFRQYGTTPLTVGNESKAAMGRMINFDSETVPSAFKKQVYGVLKQEIEDAVGKTGQLEQSVARATGQPAVESSTSALSDYLAAKKDYGNMATTEAMADRSAGRVGANRSVSLTDYLAGIGGGELGGPVVAAAAMGINKAIRRYGDQAAALGLDKLAGALETKPGQALFSAWMPTLAKAAQEGGDSLAITHYLLMKKDPAYAQAIGGQQ